MIRVAVFKRYQKFWIKKSAKKDGEVASYEELTTLRSLCEELLNDHDRKLIDAIMMDDLMERIVDDDEAATYTRLVAELQDKKSWFMVNSYLNDGSTPLHVVASKGFSDCVLAMIRKGANPNAVHSQLGHSVLHVAAMSGSHKTLNYLLVNGANRCFVNTQAGRMRSALHYAAERGSSPCLLLLLNPSQGSLIQRNEEIKAVRGILDVQDGFGNTALHLACVDGSEECVRMLIEAGANVMVRNSEGKSVVDIARLMNAMNSTNNNNNTTTSSNGVTVGTILFMVLMAAGLDPMTEKRIADDDNKRINSTEEVSLLDGPTPSSETTEPLYVIINDGHLHSSAAGAHSTKVSKRLKFVRRSLYDSREDEENTANDNAPAPVLNNLSAAKNIAKVEVFKRREEAEQRIHVCFGRKNNISEPVSPQRPAMQRKVWGNKNNENNNNNSSKSVANVAAKSTVVNNMSLVDTTTIQSVSGDSMLPANTYYTARIDSAKIEHFLSSVPHFYPDTAAAVSNATATFSVALEEEDPLWASYKRKHTRVSQNNKHSNTVTPDNHSAHNVNEQNHTKTGAYFDTSMSNKPVKLSPHKPTVVAPAAAATPNSTNAEVFEMMCRMEELQQYKSNRSAGHHTIQSKDIVTPVKAPIHSAMPNDATERSTTPPLLLDVPALSILHPATVAVGATDAGIDVTHSAESAPARFSPVLSSQQAESNLFASAKDGCGEKEEEESPMPVSFVSPALRSPDLLSIHHFHHHQEEEDGANYLNSAINEGGLSEEEAAVDPMEGCELNLATIDGSGTDDNITVSDDREGNFCSPDSNHTSTSTSTSTSTVQDSSTEGESEIEAKANRRLSVSDRVAAVERAINTSSSGNGSVVIPVPPPIAAVMHKRGSATRKADSSNQILIPVENKTT